MDKIIALDKQLFIFLNNHGSSAYDDFWLLVTKQLHWVPFFLVLAVILYKKIGLKAFLVALVTIAVMLTVTNEFTELIKNFVQRLRPCNDIEIKHLIRIVKSSDTFSYFSGHASNSMASMTFLFLLLRKHYHYVYLIFCFPLVFAYSRIYLGLHFPLDIISGYAVGLLSGYLFYQFYLKLNRKIVTSPE